jgi:spore germination cell wall hydrolase CwlJ-like protein
LPYQYLRSLGRAALCAALSALISLPALAIDPDRLTRQESPQGLPSTELTCLAEAVYFEARGEPDSGQRAVAQVVVNRAGSGVYPKSICGVVYQNQHRRNACQFSFACDGRPETKSEEVAWRKAKRIALQVASGEMRAPVLRTATHYHASYVSPSWAKKMTRLSKIGLHVFYREDL